MTDGGTAASPIDWAALPRETRARVIRLARQDRPHDDLDVARIAVAWARQVRFRRRPEFLAIPLLLGPAAAIAALHHLTDHRLPMLVALGGLLAFALIIGVPLKLLSDRRERTWAGQVEAANLVRSLQTDADLGVPEAGFRGSARPGPDWPTAAVMGSYGFLFWWAYNPLVPAIFFGGCVAASTSTSGHIERRWHPAGGPVVVLTENGPRFPSFHLDLRWTDVRHIDVAVVADVPSVRWHLVTPDVYSGQSRYRQGRLRRRIRVQGNALTIPFGWLAEPPERLVALALRYHRERSGDGSIADATLRP